MKNNYNAKNIENCPASKIQKIIHKETYREIPLKVEYSLTEIGRKFLSILDNLEE